MGRTNYVLFKARWNLFVWTNYVWTKLSWDKIRKAMPRLGRLVFASHRLDPSLKPGQSMWTICHCGTNCWETLRFVRQWHSASTLYTFSYLSPKTHNLGNWQRPCKSLRRELPSAQQSPCCQCLPFLPLRMTSQCSLPYARGCPVH